MNTFWSWFTANENKLRSIHNLSDCERTELLFWLSQHLKYYSPKIGHRLIVDPEGKEPPTLSFSICGDPEVRGLILNLMAEAPPIRELDNLRIAKLFGQRRSRLFRKRILFRRNMLPAIPHQILGRSRRSQHKAIYFGNRSKFPNHPY